MTPDPTGVPTCKPNSRAAFGDNPVETGCPAVRIKPDVPGCPPT